MSPCKTNGSKMTGRRSVQFSTVAVCMVLGACSGGGGVGGTEYDKVDSATLALRQAQANTNDLRAEFSPIVYTDLLTIPTTGSAQYSGFISGQLSDISDDVTDGLIGELQLEIAFAETDMVSGRATNFLDQRGNPVIGSIALTGGALNRDGDPNVDATFSFEGLGELTDTNGRNLELDVDFDGDFLGDQNAGIGGDVMGQVNVEGATQSFGGLFIASK